MSPAPPLSPDDLLMHARRLATRGVGNLGSTASRAAALLGRTALEESLFRLARDLRHLSGRAMFLVLPNIFPRADAHRAALVWGRLSAASHHHAYEMPPTAEELGDLLDTVHDIVTLVDERLAARRDKAAQR